MATSPEEVESIIRKVYGEIYKGNRAKDEDPEEFADKYMKEYEKWIFHQREMETEKITGEDVENIVKHLGETAGGLDQWNPADLKLLSKEACEWLAAFLNLIEGGAPWPTQMTVARAAFLAKEEDSDMGPLSYRVLLMLSPV